MNNDVPRLVQFNCHVSWHSLSCPNAADWQVESRFWALTAALVQNAAVNAQRRGFCSLLHGITVALSVNSQP